MNVHRIDPFSYSSHVWAHLVETVVRTAPADRFLLRFPPFLGVKLCFPDSFYSLEECSHHHFGSNALKSWFTIRHLFFLHHWPALHLPAAWPWPLTLVGVWHCWLQFAVDVCHQCGEVVLWGREITEPAACHLLEPELVQTGRSKPGPSGTPSYFQG